jgi:hypothetical protein
VTVDGIIAGVRKKWHYEFLGLPVSQLGTQDCLCELKCGVGCHPALGGLGVGVGGFIRPKYVVAGVGVEQLLRPRDTTGHHNVVHGDQFRLVECGCGSILSINIALGRKRLHPIVPPTWDAQKQLHPMDNLENSSWWCSILYKHTDATNRPEKIRLNISQELVFV